MSEKLNQTKEIIIKSLLALGASGSLLLLPGCKPELHKSNDSISFLTPPAESLSLEQQQKEIDELFESAKSLDIGRIAIQLPNKLPKTKTEQFFNHVKQSATKHDIRTVLWVSNGIAGEKIPMFANSKEILAKHPDWFLHDDAGKPILENESGVPHGYLNPLSDSLVKEQERIVLEAAKKVGAEEILFDDLAIPIKNSVALTAKEFIQFSPEFRRNSEHRQRIYTERLKRLRELVHGSGRKILLSMQYGFNTGFDAPLEAAKHFDEAIPQIYVQDYASSSQKDLFNIQLQRNIKQFSDAKKINPNLKITPVVFAGYPKSPNSTSGIDEMARMSMSGLNSESAGVFPLTTITNIGKNATSKSTLKNSFKSEINNKLNQ
jgi:hypothetical protein